MTVIGRILAFTFFLAGCMLGANGGDTGETDYGIGSRGPGGGWIFYDKGRYSRGWRCLEAARVDLGEAQWGCVGLSIPDTQGTEIGTGLANTRAITKTCNERGVAARLAKQYRGEGKADWFLPSKDALGAMYVNLHQNGIGGFADIYYWSSSENGSVVAWYQSFGTGDQSYNDKDYIYGLVRPIRAF